MGSERPVYRVLSGRAVVLLATALVVMSVGIAVWLLLAYGSGTEADRARLEAIKVAGTIAVGLAGSVALWLALRRQRTNEIALHQKDVDQAHQERVAASAEADAAERRLTDLYTNAVEQLGSDKAPVRLGGMYALERQAQTVPEQRQTIVNVLCAYLRMPFDPDGGPPNDGRDQERQVRLTAQRILANHLAPGDNPDRPAETFWPDIDLDLTGATLLDVNFDRCRIRTAAFDKASFRGRTWFTEAVFDKAADFRNARFEGHAWFGGSRFGGTEWFGGARFHGAQFSDAAWFAGTRFRGDASFNGARFSGAGTLGGTSFGRAEFDGRADFAKVEFSDAIWFSNTRFAGEASFHEARFTGSVSFAKSRLGGYADFTRAEFADEAEFTEAEFADTAWFNAAKFSAVGFTGTRFGDFSQFDNARFAGEVTAQRARFAGSASFRLAWFGGSVDFTEAIFGGHTDLDETLFQEEASFSDARFQKYVSLRDARFGGPANFRNAEFPDTVDATDVRVRIDRQPDDMAAMWPEPYVVTTPADPVAAHLPDSEGIWGVVQRAH